MKFVSYWHDTGPAFTAAAPGPVDGHFDVAVIGAGFTGLAAARQLAKAGTKVVVLDAESVGYGGSGRNGGHVNNGLAHSFIAAKAQLGRERAIALYQAFDEAVDAVETLVAEESIDCDFRRSGKLKLAAKPAHLEALARNFEAIHAEVDPDTALLSPAECEAEVGAPFFGAMLSRKSAMMHMGKYAVGLANAVVRHGGTIIEAAPVTAVRQAAGRHEVVTPRGTLTADNVLVATGAYTSANFTHFRRRIITVGSFLIATRPLTEAEIAATMPGDRTCVTTMHVGNYFRLSPDRRMLFGGRARFSAVSDHTSDAIGGKILQASLARMFPHLTDVPIDYCWGGLLDMTRDRFPRAGRQDGIWYVMGLSGHGAQMSTQLGTVIADAMMGRDDRNPVKDMAWPAVPGHFGKPWFLPMVGLYYKLLDRYR